MIDRADLVDDAELASFAGRVERRDEFLGMVTQWTQSPHHAGDRRSRGGVPDSGCPHRDSGHVAKHRPLRAARRVRRIGARGAAAAGAVSQRRHHDQAARTAPGRWAPTTDASTGACGRNRAILPTLTHFRCPTYE